MAENKGKTGEMVALNIISSACHATDKMEVSRPSKTNAADLGMDMSLSGKKSDIENFFNIANPGRIQPVGMQKIKDDDIIKVRIDCKNYDGKITKSAAEKFIGEVCLHPDSQYHAMVGATDLTRGAQKSFAEANKRLNEKGISLEHINKVGIYNLSEAYPAIRPANPSQPIEEIGSETSKK